MRPQGGSLSELVLNFVTIETIQEITCIFVNPLRLNSLENLRSSGYKPSSLSQVFSQCGATYRAKLLSVFSLAVFRAAPKLS